MLMENRYAWVQFLRLSMLKREARMQKKQAEKIPFNGNAHAWEFQNGLLLAGTNWSILYT